MNPNNAHKVRTCLWFEQEGAEAARFYVGLIPGSRLESEYRWDEGKAPLVINFTLAGTPYQILNAGPQYKPTPAASIAVVTEDQAETDRLWSALIADGGEESRCGWLVDRWGVSWQIVPAPMMGLLFSADQAASGRAREAMMTMRRIDLAAVEAAYRGAR